MGMHPLANELAAEWAEIKKEVLETADGRASNPNIACTNGSFIYVAYENDNVLYVGETSKSIKRRFITDGSGSHRQKNQEWYNRMTKIRFIKKTHAQLSDQKRRMLEQAFSLFLRPEFYG